MENDESKEKVKQAIEEKIRLDKSENDGLTKQPSRFLGLRFSVTFPAKDSGLFQRACRDEGYFDDRGYRYADYLKHCFEQRHSFKEKRKVLLARLVKEFEEYGFTIDDFQTAALERLKTK